MTYYNTTNETGTLLKQYREDSDKQEDRVALYFIGRPNLEVGASQVHRRLFSDRVPLTSVRRCLTNLEAAGVVEKCGKREGQYGRSESLWRLKRANSKQMGLF